jgi:hypothetical protein
METQINNDAQMFDAKGTRACCGQVAVGMDDTVPTDLRNELGRGSVIVRHCDVCFLLDGNTSPKETMYCKLCDAFMCEPCRRNKWRRMGAAIARKVKRIWQPAV